MDGKKVQGPRRLGPYPDRDIDCQEALEDQFERLIDQAEAAGWLRLEAFAALVELIENHAIADQAREFTADTIDRLRRGGR